MRYLLVYRTVAEMKLVVLLSDSQSTISTISNTDHYKVLNEHNIARYN